MFHPFFNISCDPDPRDLFVYGRRVKSLALLEFLNEKNRVI